MKFTPTPLPGAYLVDLERREDERGFFARAYCADEFGKLGLQTRFVQLNDSFNLHRATLRGMHYQLAPHAEVKLVRCSRGAIQDVILDLRPESPTYGKHFGAVLDACNRTMMYVPQGFAHGFITLDRDTEVLYQVSAAYNPASERGVRWDDPMFNIAWATEPSIISPRDLGHPNFVADDHPERGAVPAEAVSVITS